jgi:hypothetical protein
MGVRLNVVALLAFSALVACGGSKTSGEAKGPESNPWADYKGTYATAGSGSSSSKSAKSAKTEVAAAEAPKADEPAAVEEAPAPAPVAAPPPAKKGKTAGKGAKKKK